MWPSRLASCPHGCHGKAVLLCCSQVTCNVPFVHIWLEVPVSLSNVSLAWDWASLSNVSLKFLFHSQMFLCLEIELRSQMFPGLRLFHSQNSLCVKFHLQSFSLLKPSFSHWYHFVVSGSIVTTCVATAKWAPFEWISSDSKSFGLFLLDSLQFNGPWITVFQLFLVTHCPKSHFSYFLPSDIFVQYWVL